MCVVRDLLVVSQEKLYVRSVQDFAGNFYISVSHIHILSHNSI